MATLYRRPDRGNRWYLNYKDIDNRRYRIDTGTTDKVIADRWLGKVLERISLARLDGEERVGRIDAGAIILKTKGRMPLSEFLEKWKKIAADRDLSPKTVELTSSAFGSITSFLSDVAIGSVSTKNVDAWKKWILKSGNTQATSASYHRQLRAAWTDAISADAVSGNPFKETPVQKITVFKMKPDGENAEMPPKMITTLLMTIDTEEPTFGLFVRVCLYTGCRRQQALGLRARDIDLKDRILRMIRGKGRKGSDVLFPMSKALWVSFLRIGIPSNPEDYVFKNQSNRKAGSEDRWHDRYPTIRFKYFIRKLGFPDHFHLHSIRHTFSTALQRQGVPQDVVQLFLGHSSVATTQTYTHTAPIMFRDSLDSVTFEEPPEDQVV